MPTTRPRKLPAHGNHRNAVLRSWREGYRLSAIARQLRTTEAAVARIVLASGVSWLAVEARENLTRKVKR